MTSVTHPPRLSHSGKRPAVPRVASGSATVALPDEQARRDHMKPRFDEFAAALMTFTFAVAGSSILIAIFAGVF